MPSAGRTLNAGGVRTYVEEHGGGDPLLLLHGGFETVDMLPFLTGHLSKHRRVIAPERRGHGRTADQPGPITYDLMARDTLAVMDALGVEAADIVGYSDGANIAMLLALAAPDRVRRPIAGENRRTIFRRSGPPRVVEAQRTELQAFSQG